MSQLPLGATVGVFALGTMALATTLLGARAGAQALRGVHAGFARWPRIVVSCGVVGAALGGLLVAADRRGHNRIAHEASNFSLDEAMVVVRHPREPWFGPLALRTAPEARRTSRALYGFDEDGAADAFRHAYASALLSVRAMQRGASARFAVQLAREAGRAHEDRDSTDPANVRRRMDLHNNAVGLTLVGNGRTADGRWLGRRAIARRVVRALDEGRLLVGSDDRSALVASHRVAMLAPVAVAVGDPQ